MQQKSAADSAFPLGKQKYDYMATKKPAPLHSVHCNKPLRRIPPPLTMGAGLNGQGRRTFCPSPRLVFYILPCRKCFPEMFSGMGEGQNVPTPTRDFSIPRIAIFLMRGPFWLTFVRVYLGYHFAFRWHWSLSTIRTKERLFATRRKMRLIEGNVKSRHNKMTCKGTLRQVFICLRPRTPHAPPPLHNV